jgi:2-keto-4-pentenoate hydratase/2-oxohepta-3-ene-1,7-dioic acid hydratase in catechol pathway
VVARIVRFGEPDAETPAYGVVDGDDISVIEPHPFTHHRPTGRRVALEEARLLAPVLPSKVVCVGRNYHEHAVELGGEVPDEPLLFLKPSTAVIGPFEPIRYPTDVSNEVHYEGELAVVIGRRGAGAARGDAVKAIYGFTCANDVTARDLQRSDDQWTRAKGFDTFCPLGPAIATDVDPGAATVRTYVDDELRQDGTTADLVFDVATLVAYASHVMTLLPGDVILTGTPAGVGPLEVGQTVRVEIDGIGALENTVAAR